MAFLPSMIMSMEEYEAINDLIAERFGIYFPEHKKDILESRLARRLSQLGLKSFMDYYFLLQYNPNGELDSLAHAVLNHETYFFRETHQFNVLFEHAFETLRDQCASPKRLRLLCAGCSSGEEPYTLNIYAKENQFRMWGYEIQIDAFDLEQERVDMALRASYGPSSMRSLTGEQVPRYFTAPERDQFVLRPLFRFGVHFFRGNILDLSTFGRYEPYDAVFCRNVLIYFSEIALHKAIENFSRVLHPGGLLFLGHSESIIGVSPRMQAVRLGDSIAYRRTSA